jgi:eukaryotic-like serine/threonine-protein kinase
MAASVPKKIGKYDVIDVIGRGGMGIVYRAKDPYLDRLVAIKIMTINTAEYPDLLDRFFREAKATASFQHANIVTVYELGEHEGSPFLAMQYLEGSSLDAIIRSRQNLPLLQKLGIIIQVCHGLAYAHQLKVVHRDIKPGNIMVLKDGNVKIVDFGIARIGDTNFTRTGQFMGSLNYMSLEQLNEKLQVDQRTDVYSTGVVLYQLLTGALPFEAESTGATLMKIMSEAPPPFSKYISSFPPELETITLKALAKDRDQRYLSADEFALDLSQLEDHLKEDAIGGYLQQAELLLEKNEWLRAHEQLLEVLKIERQNTRAVSMLRSVRKQIEKEQSIERARQLKTQAEEALHREEFDAALGFLEQAISLDQTNADLQKFRSEVQSAKAEAEHRRQVLLRVDSARRQGNLDTAKQALEELLARKPDDTRLKSLYRIIQKELEEQQKQKGMQSLLDAARRELSHSRHTAALDLLKEAEKLDPDAPQLRDLLTRFTTAREQQQRRHELERITRQVEQAINADDHQSALNLIADGLRQFPNDPSLSKFRELAESQKQAAQVKSFVREKLAGAQEILNAGNATHAIKILEESLRKVPGNPNLESLLAIAQERLTQERDEQSKSSVVEQANSLVGRGDCAGAIRVLEAGQLRFAAAPEIDNLLRFAREQQSKQARQQEIEASVRRAQELLRAQDYDRAVELLQSVQQRSPDEDVLILLEQARRRRNELNRDIAAAIAKAQQFLAEGSQDKAVEFLQSQPSAYRRSEEFREMLQAAFQQQKMQETSAPTSIEEESEAPTPSATIFGTLDTLAPVESKRSVAPIASKQLPRVQPPSAGPPPQPRPLPRQEAAKRKFVMAAAVITIVLVLFIAIRIFWASAAIGTVLVHTNVNGVELFVDDKSQGVIGSNQEMKLPLKEGHHTIRAQKSGYETPAVQTVDIAKNTESSPISFVLTASIQPTPLPSPQPVQTGTLEIQIGVENADVFVDSQAKQVVREKKLELSLPVGDHSVRVEKQNYNELTKKVHVDADKTAKLDFPLSERTKPVGYFDIVSAPGAKVRVDQQDYSVPPDGKLHVTVEPSQHSIQISLEGYSTWGPENRTAKANQTLEISAGLTAKSASIVSFDVSPRQIRVGDSVTLEWQTANATEVVIDPGSTDVRDPAAVSHDKMQRQPRETTTFVITARGPGQPARSTPITVTVVAASQPASGNLSANPNSVQKGQAATLIWTTKNAASVSIDNGIGQVDANGQRSVSPTSGTIYTLTIKGADGTSTTSTARVEVTSPAPPPPNNPPPATLNVSGLRDALDRLQDAYATVSVDEMIKAWPSLKNDNPRRKGLQESFRGVQALRVRFADCGTPSTDGSVAKMACTQNQTNTVNGKVQPTQSHAVQITFRKTGDLWFVDNVTGK